MHLRWVRWRAFSRPRFPVCARRAPHTHRGEKGDGA
nr:MAG TPA: hypothetical protein [Caudoviricetes sp.]